MSFSRLILVVASGWLLAAGCGRFAADPVEPGSPPTGAVRVGIVPRAGGSAYWKSVENGAKRAAVDLKVELLWKPPLQDGDRAAQIQAVESLLTEDIQAIGLAPLDPKLPLRPLQQAPRRLPVVLLEAPMEGEPGRDFVTLVGTDHRDAGRRAAFEVVRLLQGHGRVVILRGANPGAEALEREAGFREVAGRQPDLALNTTVLNLDDRRSPEPALADGLRGADGLYAAHESAARVVMRALRGADLRLRVFVGHDESGQLLPAVEEGGVRALLIQDPERIGYEAVKALAAAVRGRPVPPRVDIGVALITAENRHSPEIKALLGEN
jgi:ribose transport system substrate-binding protein